MAFKMQTEATDAFDLNKEPQAMRDLYGRTTQGNQLLIARRLIERGVRFVQVWPAAGTIIRTSRIACPSAPKKLINRWPRSSPI